MFFLLFFFLNSFGLSDPQEVSLGNKYLTVTWNINDSGSLLTKNLLNQRAQPEVTIIPQTGSEEFTISILRDNSSPYPTPISDKSKWTITANSEKNTEGDDGPIKNLIDNNPHTIWHSWESEEDDKTGHDDRENHAGDYNITINFGEKLTFKAISFTQKPINLDGVVRKFKLFVGDSLEDVTNKVKKGEYILDSYFAQDKNKKCYLNLTEEVTTQFVVITTKGDGKFGTGAQFDIYSDFIPYLNDVIKASELKCKDASKEENKVTFTFDTYELNNAKFDIIEVVELIQDKPYMEKHLEIKCSDENVKLDYIDLDHYVLTNDDHSKSWTCPFVDELFMSLGQPYYMNTFYAGCRFPYTHTMIETTTNLARIRYHSGKSFKDLKKNDQNMYVTWKTVLGASRDSRIEVVRNDFFAYISDISVPSPFRKQYNSWYDWMLKITEENIMISFKEIERGCTQYGLPPFDSYVVDDGWNNYNSDKYGVYDVGTSGTTYNQDGFWEFNDKFPNKFKNPSDFTRKISSNFGVWLGPRGGYVTPGKFGQMIEDAKKGFYNPQSDDIDVGSHTYLKNVQQLLVDFIKTYKVNYYKLDGFVEQPCFNETHDHMVGGPDGLYYFTDLWENVYVWYEDMIKTAKETGLDNFWISTTTWAAPSPFQLQWSNSVWIQISGDKGEIIIGDNINQADQCLTYRDDCYWQFYDEMELQFPARCLYNHDPIYGQAGTTLRGSLNDDFFRTFLYGCAMRGTAFFELYYTYDMLDEGDKWYISSDVLSWAEGNFDTLQHSQIFGGRPGIGEFYGFSAWNTTNGVIGIRNPGAEVVEEKIIIDRNIGVPEDIGTVYRSTLLDHKTENQDETKNKVPFKYGDELKVTLVPGEYRIYEFRPTNDNEAPTIEVVKSTKETEIMIRFNKRVVLNDASFSIQGVTVNEARLRGDRRTVTLSTSPMINYTNYKLEIKGVKDIFDNELSTTVDFQYFTSNLISSIRGEFSGSDSVFVDTTVATDSFTIRLNVKDFKDVKNAVLLHSEDNSIIVEITSDNHIKFTVGKTSVTSESEINKDTHFVTLVRERNALIKIYIGTEIDSSQWDKQMANTVSIHNLILNKNEVVYTYVKVFNYGLAYSEVSEEVSLKNEYIERVFSISNNKVKTLEIINYRTDSIISITPQEGSEEFLFSVPIYDEKEANGNENIYRVKNDTPEAIDRTNWHASANSEQSTIPGKEGSVYNLIDGNLNTMWHSKYNDKGQGGHDDRYDPKDPFQVTFDLKKETEFKAFSYTPRQSGLNGRINHYEIYVENSMEELNKSIKDKKYKMKGDFHFFAAFPVYVNFTNPQKGRYVALLSVDHDSFGSGADFNLYEDFVPLPHADIKSSSFELDHYEIKEKENSQLLIFTYKPYSFNDVQFNITVEYELQNDKHYIEKEIKIKIPQNKYNDIKFDYFDLDHLVISNNDKEKSWTHPMIDSSGDYIPSKYILTLGQPIYINSFFTGCRFPFSDNQIVDNLSYLRYQAGKTYQQLNLGEDGTYCCWKTVLGSARSTNIEVIRNDFFSYITDISVENKFRKQYNSWYDWMLTITESNILSSFKEIEKGCTQMGVKPLDSYVIDDGWNNYNYDNQEYHVYDEAKSGTTYNDVGFWAINNKFPDGFNKPAEFAQSVSSNFGVWLGPRGGYNFMDKFGHMIENAGFGYHNAQSNDVDVASTKYTAKLKEFWNDWIKKYKVNYYKLDGWLLKPCENKDHDHVVGGFDGVYEYSDYWERYIDVFKSMRETALQNDINNLWISLTCYINPSPFHLQWANSIWIQISDDVGYIKLSDKDTLADQMLNYRDNVYYNFYHVFQFQLPQQSVYNHDPIYGKTGTQLEGSLNDDEFRKFLLMCGMRGNSFFELYYTYTMIDEGDKWYVNSEILNYIENRHDVLQHSQIFGEAPEKGSVYGYSSWSKERGTIAIRNPSNEVKEYTIKLNRDIGVPENIGTVYRKIVLDFNSIEDLKEGQEQHYDDEIKVTLQPRELRIIDFEPEQDTESAKVEVLKIINQKEIQIRFNKKIRFDINNYLIDDVKISEGKLRGDLRTVSLYLQDSFENNTEYVITLNDVKDSIGHSLNTQVRFVYMAGNMIVTVPNEIGPIEEDCLLSTKEYQVDSFTFQLNIKDLKEDSNQVLIKDDRNEVSVEIVDKKIKFKVQSISVSSKQQVPLNMDINVTCVRERNTMIKIYINGQLSSSNYAEDQSEIISLKYIQLCKSTAIFNSIIVSSFGYSYKDALETNEKVIRVKTAIAEATSEVEGHEASNAIDDNEVTYWLSKEEKDQSIKVSLDRSVFIEKVGYVAHDEKTAIKEYTISVSLDNKDWVDISGSWANKNDQREAVVNQKVKFLILKGTSISNSISASQIYFYGSEIENEDHNPTPPPPPTPMPTRTTQPEPTDEPEDDENKEKAFVIVGVVVGGVMVVVITAMIIVLLRKRKPQDKINDEPLISVK